MATSSPLSVYDVAVTLTSVLDVPVTTCRIFPAPPAATALDNPEALPKLSVTFPLIFLYQYYHYDPSISNAVIEATALPGHVSSLFPDVCDLTRNEYVISDVDEGESSQLMQVPVVWSLV